MCERLRYTWAFDLSVYMGFRQVPLNVDELNCPRFAFGYLAESSFRRITCFRIKTYNALMLWQNL